MDRNLRRSIPSKMTAIGFIFVTLFGNLWIGYLVLGQQVPDWLNNGLYGGIFICLLGGAGLLVLVVYRMFGPCSSVTDEDGADGEERD